MCTSFVGSLDIPARDIEQRLSIAIIGRSPVARQLAFARERGWRNLKFYEPIGDDFARDFQWVVDGDEWAQVLVWKRDGERAPAVLGGRRRLRDRRPRLRSRTSRPIRLRSGPSSTGPLKIALPTGTQSSNTDPIRGTGD